jgi:hypothetical protein
MIPKRRRLAQPGGRRDRYGVTACSALLRATPAGAAASWIAYWKNSDMPAGRPAGQAGHESGIEPTPFVNSDKVDAGGTGTSVPPLKGVGVLAKETKRFVSDEGFALVSVSEPGEPEASVPAPARAGTPATPASPKPRSSHAEGTAGQPHFAR